MKNVLNKAAKIIAFPLVIIGIMIGYTAEAFVFGLKTGWKADDLF
jgi:hypothetical protein